MYSIHNLVARCSPSIIGGFFSRWVTPGHASMRLLRFMTQFVQMTVQWHLFSFSEGIQFFPKGVFLRGSDD